MKPSSRAPLLAAACGMLLLVACGSQQPVVTATDIATAERTGTLPSLYNRLKAETVGKDRARKKDAPLFAQMDDIGARIAGAHEADLRRQMEAARIDGGIVPATVLTDMRSAAEPMRTWEPARFDRFNLDLARENGMTDKQLREAQAGLAALPAEAVPQRVAALGRLAAISGDSRYAEQAEAIGREVRAAFEQAKATDDFETALRLLDQLPKDNRTESTRVELQTRLFERQFNEALAEDRPDDAYRLFNTLSTSPFFPEIRARVEPTAADMATYFVALGSSAVAAGNIGDAWRWFTQARAVKRKLGAEVTLLPEEKPFVDRIYRGHDAARKENQWGLAYGYLAIVSEFDPSRPTLARDARTAEEEVAKQAHRSAMVTPFTTAPGNTDYSTSMATRVTEYLFQNAAGDVRIVTADGKTAADLEVTGSIDEARVASSQTPVAKTQRVVTARGLQKPNPKYEEWQRLSERQRRNTPPPPATLSYDQVEDVSYNIVQVRKTGYFSVAFRIVDTATGKITLTDSVTLKREFTDESSEGIDKGQFQLPARVARLPTDIDILNDLASEAAADIGKRLVARLGNSEKRHAEAGKAAAADGNLQLAAQEYARAVVIGNSKGADIAALRNDLKRVAAGAGYAR